MTETPAYRFRFIVEAVRVLATALGPDEISEYTDWPGQQDANDTPNPDQST